MRIRFYGTPESLKKWLNLVGKTLKRKITSPIIEMTSQERETIQRQLWYAKSDTGHGATGHPFRWNDCITYKEIS